MRESILQVLMRRDGMEEVEALELIEEARYQIDECIDEGDLDAAEYVIKDMFGLEPDYLDEFLF